MEIRRFDVPHENQYGLCAVFFPSPPSPYMMRNGGEGDWRHKNASEGDVTKINE